MHRHNIKVIVRRGVWTDQSAINRAVPSWSSFHSASQISRLSFPRAACVYKQPADELTAKNELTDGSCPDVYHKTLNAT